MSEAILTQGQYIHGASASSASTRSTRPTKSFCDHRSITLRRARHAKRVQRHASPLGDLALLVSQSDNPRTPVFRLNLRPFLSEPCRDSTYDDNDLSGNTDTRRILNRRRDVYYVCVYTQL